MAIRKMDFAGAVVLAPMVRVSTHPMRLLALRYGATYVYTEEIIDFKLLRTRRFENTSLKTVDFCHDDGTVVFRTSSEETGKVILQLGTACGERALLAAKMVEKDVAGIDVNMGCPKEYSIKGGMGAALLKKPEQVKKLLETLVLNLSIPVTCKIRILDKLEDTLNLVKIIESTGVAAITVHGRKPFERSSNSNHDDAILAVSNVVKVPVLANGGSKSSIRLYDDIEFFRQTTGAAGVMIARAAMWNPAIFSPPPDDCLPPSNVDLVREYIELAVKYDHHIIGTKYCVQRMLNSITTSEDYVKTNSVNKMSELCEIWGLSAEIVKLSENCTDDRVTVNKSLDPVEIEPSVEAPVEAKRGRLDTIVLPIGFVRSEWPEVGDTPRLILMQYCQRENKTPVFSTEENKALRSFISTVILDDVHYTHSIPSKSKRYAEQAAALVCLKHLRISLAKSS